MVGVFIGFCLAFSELSDPVQAFHWLSVFVVVSIAGVTAFESLFFSKQAGRPFQFVLSFFFGVLPEVLPTLGGSNPSSGWFQSR